MNLRCRWLSRWAVWLVLGVLPVHAASRFWDSATSAGYQHGNGVWSTNAVDVGWTLTGTEPLAPWVNGDRANFTAVGGVSRIVLSNAVAVTGVVISGSAYTLVITNGGVLANTLSYSRIGNGSDRNRVEMHGGTSPVLWDQGAVDFVVGFTSCSNEFIINGNGVPGSAILTNLNTTTTSAGRGAGSFQNRMVITNGGSMFNAGIFTLGYTADRNDLTVFGGNSVFNGGNATFNLGNAGSSNILCVNGEGVAGSAVCSNWSILRVGYNAAAQANLLLVTNGGYLASRGSVIGQLGSHNEARITGTGSIWDGSSSTLIIGNGTGATGNRLVVTDGGSADRFTTVTINSNNFLQLLGGTLKVADIASTMGSLCMLGDGIQTARLNIQGGSCSFDAGVWILSNAVICGNGVLSGGTPGLVFTNGAILAPGEIGAGPSSIGTLTLGASTWKAGMVLDLDVTNINGVLGTDWDFIQVNAPLAPDPAGGRIRISLDSQGEMGGFNPIRNFTIPLVSFTSSTLTTNDFEINTNAFLIGSNWTLQITETNLALVYRHSVRPLYVSTNGTDAGGTNWTTAFTNLQDALDEVWDDDTIYLAGQTFRTAGPFVWTGARGVIIRGGYAAASDVGLPGTNDPATWPTILTVVTPGYSNRVLLVTNLLNGTLSQVTITGGYETNENYGGGVGIIGSTNLLITACMITSNTLIPNAGTYGGGGIGIRSSDVTISNSWIRQNSNGRGGNINHGGGIYNNGTLRLLNSFIISNQVVSTGHKRGGGVCNDSGTVLIRNCQFIGNTSGQGGAIYSGNLNSSCTVLSSLFQANDVGTGASLNYGAGGGILNLGASFLMRNSLMVGNISTFGALVINHASAGYKSAIESCTIVDNVGTGVYKSANGTAVMTNSIIWGHVDDLAGSPVAVMYSDIQTADSFWTNGVDGCISANPLFVDSATRDYRLRGGSPCISAGTNSAWMTDALDLGGNRRLQYGRVDMGAYESAPPGAATMIQIF